MPARSSAFRPIPLWTLASGVSLLAGGASCGAEPAAGAKPDGASLDTAAVFQVQCKATVKWSEVFPLDGYLSLAFGVHPRPSGDMLVVTRAETEAEVDTLRVLALDGDGKVQWDALYGDPETSTETGGLVLLPDGQFVLMVGQADTDAAGGQRILVCGDEGMVFSENVIESETVSQVSGALLMPDGRIAVSGATPESSTDQGSWWNAVVDVNGTVIWEKTGGTPGWDSGSKLLMLSGGQLLYMARLDEDGSGDTLVMARSPAGELYWEQTLSGEGHRFLYLMDEVSGGVLILGDASRSPPDRVRFGVGVYGDRRDVFSAALDLDGNLLWSKQALWDERGTQVFGSVVAADGGLFVVGMHGLFPMPSESYGGYLARLGQDAERLWETGLQHESKTVFPLTLAVWPDGDLIVAGYRYSVDGKHLNMDRWVSRMSVSCEGLQ